MKRAAIGTFDFSFNILKIVVLLWNFEICMKYSVKCISTFTSGCLNIFFIHLFSYSLLAHSVRSIKSTLSAI